MTARLSGALVASLALLALFAAGATRTAPDAQEPRYVIFSIMAPEALGSSAIELTLPAWDESERREVERIRARFGAQRPGHSRYVGFSVALLPTLNLTPEQLKAEVDRALDLAEQESVPVFFHLDDEHFWWLSPELSKNPDMAEWTDFPGPGEARGPRMRRYWLPWGEPMNVYDAPFPCFACPAFRAAVAGRLKDCVAAPIVRRLTAWNKEGKGYLFAGLASGNETQVPDLRAEARKSWPWSTTGWDVAQRRKVIMTPEEMQPIGYHSLYQLGYSQQSIQRLAKDRRQSVEEKVEELLATVAHDYAEFQSKTLSDAGLPKDRLYTHFTSTTRTTKAPLERPSSGRPGSGNLSPPMTASVNPYSRPGFTVVRSGVDLNELVAQLSQAGAPERGRAWAAVESYVMTGQPGVPQTEAQYAEYLGGLLAHGARVVNVYGWNIPSRFPYSVENSGALPAVRRWLAGEALASGWSGEAEQAQMARLREKMDALQKSGKEAIARGVFPLRVFWIFKRFQWSFEPAVKGGKPDDAEAALDLALSRMRAL